MKIEGIFIKHSEAKYELVQDIALSDEDNQKILNILSEYPSAGLSVLGPKPFILRHLGAQEVKSKQLKMLSEAYESNKETLETIEKYTDSHDGCTDILVTIEQDPNGFFEQGFNNALEFVFNVLGIDIETLF